MKRSASSFFLMVLFAVLAHAGEPVPVELEWEEVAGAKIYQLEFVGLDGKKVDTFESKTPIFHFQMRVGRYKVRSRVADERKVYGEWSKLNDLVIQPKTIALPETEKAVTTKGVIDPKTRTAVVDFQWPAAAGAEKYRLKVVNKEGKVVSEKILTTPSVKLDLPAGEYSVIVTSIGGAGIESDPVTLPEKVNIQTVQLEKPEFVFTEAPASPKEKSSATASPGTTTTAANSEELTNKQLPKQNGVPVLRWKPLALSQLSGVLEYRYFLSDKWIPLDVFATSNAHEWILEKATKPGRYRVTAWAEAQGLSKSDTITYEFVVKPTSY